MATVAHRAGPGRVPLDLRVGGVERTRHRPAVDDARIDIELGAVQVDPIDVRHQAVSLG
jgi:hypothetical protein